MSAEFDKARCARRNRLAARRDGVEALPLRIFAALPGVAADDDPTLRTHHGLLPATDTTALARINALLPAGSTPLTLDDVYIHYFEAANSNYIPDRSAFMDPKTLRNLAREAPAGVAFMNSHRDGGMSHPADLPMGRTFAGRYEEYQDGSKRALGGFYMLRGLQPNGQNGPSTDDLHRMIDGGTTFDVSVGLYGGDMICDVCGNEVGDYEACKHVPGTTHDMQPDDITAQKARGVPKGAASYSIVDAHLAEVSAVYDGAVPGAGFRKTLALARRHQLSRADLLDARQAYARLLGKDDLRMDDITAAVAEGVEQGIAQRRRRVRAARDETPASVIVAEQIAVPVVDAERQRFERERAEFAAQKQEFAKQQHWAHAERDVERLISEARVLPAENLPVADGQPALVAVFAQALADDATGTALFGQDGGNRYTALLNRYSARQPQVPLGENLPVAVLGTGPETPPVDLAARRKEVLALSPLGRQALKKEG